MDRKPNSFYNKMIEEHIRKTLLEKRIELGLSREEIKETLKHKSVTNISRFEQGKGMLRLIDIYILAQKLGLTLTEVFPDIEKPFTPPTENMNLINVNERHYLNEIKKAKRNESKKTK